MVDEAYIRQREKNRGGRCNLHQAERGRTVEVAYIRQREEKRWREPTLGRERKNREGAYMWQRKGERGGSLHQGEKGRTGGGSLHQTERGRTGR